MKYRFLPLIFVLAFSACNNNNNQLTFLVGTDIHADIIHDELSRLSDFVIAAEEKDVDFIIELGDFCQAIPDNKQFLDIWNSYVGSDFHVLGNHDMDLNSKEQYLAYTGMVNNYYSFDLKGFHFIVLDPNYFETDDGFIDYKNGNYYAHGSRRCNIPPDQLEWLKKDLQEDDSPCIVFSHQGLLEKGSVRNKEEVRAILENSERVIVAFSGHAHSDYYEEINGIHYLIINSMSDIWVGEKYMNESRFSKEINELNPSLKYTIPYTEPLFATVSVGKGKISITGVTGDFFKPGPGESGIPDIIYDLPATASIKDREFDYKY